MLTLHSDININLKYNYYGSLEFSTLSLGGFTLTYYNSMIWHNTHVYRQPWLYGSDVYIIISIICCVHVDMTQAVSL